MNNSVSLRDLATSGCIDPPYGFEEYERRRAVVESRRRAGVWSMAASLGALGLVAMLALVTQSPEPVAHLSVATRADASATTADVPYQPALVDLGQFEVTSELEDHIALLDAQISAARAYEAPAERVRQMEFAREQLNNSLQRVSLAQSLLGP